MKRIELLTFGFLLALLIISCGDDDQLLTESSTNELQSELRCPPGGCGPAAEKCEIICMTGGFKIVVHEHAPGVHRLSYVPMNIIYADFAFHSANYPTNSTSDPYTYLGFLLNNTDPNGPWKDVNGNVIMGGVYMYILKNIQCSTFFTTDLLYGLSNPCDLNEALLHLNQASDKPSDCGFNTGPDILCPSAPITNIPQLPDTLKQSEVKPTTTITNKYGRLCNLEHEGFCFKKVDPVSPNEPQIGPATYRHLIAQNQIKVNFWRDPATSVIEISEEETEISEDVKIAFLLEEEVKFKAGSYEVQEGQFEYGFVVIDLEY